jgi:cytochrome bd-type quinol oxidase subunit 2
MKQLKMIGTGLTCIGFLYFIVYWIGGQRLGISDAGMRLFRIISFASLGIGYAMVLWAVRNDKQQFRRLLIFILIILLFLLGIVWGSRL